MRRISCENRPEAASTTMQTLKAKIQKASQQQLLSALLHCKSVRLTRLYGHSITSIDFSSFGGTNTIVAGGEGKRGGAMLLLVVPSESRVI